MNLLAAIVLIDSLVTCFSYTRPDDVHDYAACVHTEGSDVKVYVCVDGSCRLVTDAEPIAATKKAKHRARR